MKGTIDVLVNRRSVRAYKKEQISKEQLDTILKVGTYAPSGMGIQPAVMVVVQDAEMITHISKLNAAVNGSDKDPFYGAPTLIIVFGDSTQRNYLHDSVLVMGNLMNAAYAVGVDSCYINRAKQVFATDEGKRLMQKWGLSDDYEGIANCLLGYHDGEYPIAQPRKEGYIIFD